MKIKLSKINIFIFFAVIFSVKVNVAQQNILNDTVYQKVLLERTEKILKPLSISRLRIYKKKQAILMQQYIDVNLVHEKFTTNLAAIRAKNLSTTIANEKIKTEEEQKRLLLDKLHRTFTIKISKKLKVEQIEKLKDGMTYHVLPKTWAAYLDMLQNLTQAQKDQMYKWLVEARELAMDEGTSDAKHAVFGKYKGKINNYLSAQGYDMKKEGNDWAVRTKEKQRKTNKN